MGCGAMMAVWHGFSAVYTGVSTLAFRRQHCIVNGYSGVERFDAIAGCCASLLLGVTGTTSYVVFLACLHSYFK